MSIAGRLISRWMHLPPAETHDIVITRNIQIPMPDGAICSRTITRLAQVQSCQRSWFVLLMAGEDFSAA